jgi:Calpain family cysteine protease
MALQHKGAQLPGPLGRSDAGIGGRLPGPLGFRLVWVAAPGAVAQVKKTLKMPPPASGDESYYVHSFTSKLYNKGGPAVVDVQQGALAVCPIAAILAALAHTASGRKHIESVIGEHSGVVETDLAAVAGKLNGANSKIVTNRYFAVTLGKKTFEVSDVLYTDDADRNWSPLYMKEPTEALWACIIEKAFAVQMGSYEELDREGTTLNHFWKILLGTDPKVLPVTDDTDLSKIKSIAAAASNVPTVGASRDDPKVGEQSRGKVSSWHGYAILGLRGSNIELYDPHRKKLELSLAEFRSYFQAMFSGNP